MKAFDHYDIVLILLAAPRVVPGHGIETQKDDLMACMTRVGGSEAASFWDRCIEKHIDLTLNLLAIQAKYEAVV